MSSTKPQPIYHIVRLESENIKRLKAISIEPDGNVIEITGDNDQGKTSLLDSIFWALGGTTAIQDDPIRLGEKKARVFLDLGTLQITRRMTRAEEGGFTTTLTVENEEGARFSTPQKMLDAIIGELTFDPLEFTRKKPKEQFDTLKAFVTGYNFEDAARRRKKVFDERTNVGRRADEMKVQAKGIQVADDTPDEPVDESALSDEMQRAGEHNSEIERRKATREAVSRNITSMEDGNRLREDRAASLQRQIDELERQITAINEEARQATLTIQSETVRLLDAPELPDAIDPSEIRAKIDEARITNGHVAKKKQRADLEAQAEEQQAKVKQLTTEIEAIDAEKTAAISAAKMPVEGIGFGEDVVLLNGFPLDQASGAQQLRASIALTMAANPKLRILMVRDGSLLDKNSFQIIADMAKENNFQIWVESVNSERAGAIVIEDGHIRGAEQPVAAAAE